MIRVIGKNAREFWAGLKAGDLQKLDENIEKRHKWLSGEAEEVHNNFNY